MLESRSKSSPTVVSASGRRNTVARQPIGDVLDARTGFGKLLIGGNFDHGDAVRQHQKR